MDLTFRDLTDADAESVAALRHEAFGAPRRPDAPPSGPKPGQRWLGAVAADGRVVGRVASNEYESWWGGEALPTCGIVGVAVAPEAGGQGVMRGLLGDLLRERHAAGDVVAGLFGTAPGIYRSSGFEVVAELVKVAIPMPALVRFHVPAGLSVSRARADEAAEIRALYAETAAASNGPLTRTGPLFSQPDEELVADVSGYSLVRDSAGRLVGYAAWDRSGSHHLHGFVTVHELVFSIRGAAEALLATFTGLASVCDRIELWTSEPDPLQHLLAGVDSTTLDRRPYSIRVLDLEAACTRRTWPASVSVDLAFVIDDPVIAANSGRWRLVVRDGSATLERRDDPDASLTTLGIGAFSLLWSGAVTPTDLRRLGHLSGGAAADDDAWAALTRSRPVRIFDYY